MRRRRRSAPRPRRWPALIDAAERLAATDDAAGPARLWAGEEGEALADHAERAAQAALPLLPDQRRAVLPGLLDAVLEGEVVRSRRALARRAAAPSIRACSSGACWRPGCKPADTMVLGGLVEGVWPPAADPGPWLSRPMRATVGLPSPEEAVGQAAHDFVAAACAAPEVVLSCPRRRDGAPAVPARWLTRLEMFLTGQRRGACRSIRPSTGRARSTSPPARPRAGCPAGAPPAGRAAPAPAERDRDRDLAARSLRDLRPPRAAAEAARPAGPGDRRRGLRRAGASTACTASCASTARAGRPARRRGCARRWCGALAEAGLREALRAWWAPRLDRIADWVAEIEAARRAVRRADGASSPRRAARGRCRAPAGAFELVGRADRIERRRRRRGWRSWTTRPARRPARSEVDAGLAPQLLLEAAMAEAGAFGAELGGTGGGAGLLAPDRRLRTRRGALAVQGRPAAIATRSAAGAPRDRRLETARVPDRPHTRRRRAGCYLSQPQPAGAPGACIEDDT